MDNINQNTDGTTSPSRAGGNPVEWESQIRALEARITGLQTALNAKHNELESTRHGLEKTIAQLTQELQAKQSEAEKSRQELSEYQKKLEEAVQKASEQESISARMLREVQKYQTLAQYPQVWSDLPVLLGSEEKGKVGLLPSDLEGDKLKAWLETYISRIGNAQESTKSQILSGVSSAGGSQRQATPSRDVLMQQMLKLQAEGKGQSPEYDALYAELLKL